MTSPDDGQSANLLPENFPSFLNHRLGAEEVVSLYRIVLGRPPENLDIIDRHVQTKVTIAEFLQVLLASPEYLERQRELANQELVGRIDVDGTPEQIQRLIAHARTVWTGYGESDPYWSVLTDDLFRQGDLEGTAAEQFYASGSDDAAALADLAAQHAIDLPVDGRILDFGCGVGRIGQHLSKMFASYVGVDISSSHLKIAADRFAELGQSNARFLSLSDYVDGTDSFDCVYSILVLQHNPPPIITYLLTRLVDSLRPGGVGLVQVPCALATYEFDLAGYLDQMSSRSEMEMHALPQYVVRDVLEAAGCRLVACLDDGRIVPHARSMMFLFQKGASTS
jgi:SAM-dependent methyltransferase